MSSFWRGSSKALSEKSDKSKPAEIVMDPRESASPKPESDVLPGYSLGSLVPDFTASSTQGKIEWHRWIGDSWAVLFSQPAAFNPICTTEVASLAKLSPEFEKRGVKIVVVTGNTVDENSEWVRDIEMSGLAEGCPIGFPVISDSDRSIAESYRTLDPVEKGENGVPLTCRAVTVVGPDKRLKMSMLYPFAVGRNLDEILRTIDCIQLHSNHGVYTPANWVPGEKCFIAADMEQEEATEKLGKITSTSMQSGKDYMRLVNDPSGQTPGKFSLGGFVRSILGVGSGVVLGIFAGKYVKPLREKLN